MCKEFVQTCHPGCTSSQPKNSPAPMVPRDTPAKPWQVCATDYKGPIGGPRGYYFHVLIDLYSKWPEIAVTKSTKFEKLLPVLDSSFCTHGVPEEIIHDNGPPYTSYAWKEYAEEWGFQSKTCTEEHPQSNGLAERMMASIVKLTHASLAEGKDPKQEISKFLLSYRNTPHSSTKKTPSELMMERKIRTKVPVHIPPAVGRHHSEAQANDQKAKAKQKEYGDKRRGAKHKLIKQGDEVLLSQKKTTTKQPFDPDPFTVVEVEWTKITAVRRGKERTRNVEKWRKVKPRPMRLQWQAKEVKQRYQEDSDSEGDFDLEFRQEDPGVGRERQEVQCAEVPVEREVNQGEGAEADGEAQPEEREEERDQPQRRSQRNRQLPERFRMNPQQRKKRQGEARKREKMRTPEAVIRFRGVNWGPPREQEQEDGHSEEEGTD